MSDEAGVLSYEELEVPNWIDDELFRTALSHCERTAVMEILGKTLASATVRGDHYTSNIISCTVEYIAGDGKRKSRALILKIAPELDPRRKTMSDASKIFETEVKVYTEILPRIEAALHAIGETALLSPPCVYCSLHPRKLIVLDDMLAHGYHVVRDRATNFDELALVYAKLAKFHAVSFKLVKTHPELFEELRYSFASMPSMLEQSFITNGLGKFINTLERYADLRKYKPYFESIKHDYLQKLKRSVEEYTENRQPHANYVLCHGDFHGRNMMFKYNAETAVLENCVFLDYQFSAVGPMVKDFIYSSFTLMSREMREKHRHDFINIYFSNLLDTLTRVGFDGAMPTLAAFQQQLKDHKDFELFLVHTFLPVILGWKDKSLKPEDILYSDDCRNKLFDSPEFVDELRTLLPEYEKLGYFENI